MLEVGSTLHADRRSPARPMAKGNPAAGLESNVRTRSGNQATPALLRHLAVENATGLAQSQRSRSKGQLTARGDPRCHVPKRHVQG